MSQSLCNSLFLHFYIFLQCEDVLNIVSYIVPPSGAKVLQEASWYSRYSTMMLLYQSPSGAKVLQVGEFYPSINIIMDSSISPLPGRKSCKTYPLPETFR